MSSLCLGDAWEDYTCACMLNTQLQTGATKSGARGPAAVATNTKRLQHVAMFSILTECGCFMINYIQHLSVVYSTKAIHHPHAQELWGRDHRGRHAHMSISIETLSTHAQKYLMSGSCAPITTTFDIITPTHCPLPVLMSHYYVGELELKGRLDTELLMQSH